MNTVVQKFTADGITAIGGIPSMTSSEEEIESFVVKTHALTINLGTLDAARRKGHFVWPWRSPIATASPGS